MASFFADFSTFSSWLGTKTESELKSKLYRADSGARLNGSKPDLVRRLVETTRHLGTERQLNIFPELRRRLHQNDLARAAAAFRQARQHVEDSRTDVSSAATHRQGMSNTRLIATTTSRLINNSSGRPVPTFNSSFRRPLTIPVSPHLGPQHPRGSTLQPQAVRHPHSSIFTGLCLVYAIKHNGLWLNTILCINANYLCFTLHSKHSHLFYCLFTGGERTPEQMLRETLEIQAGLIIQSISQAATPGSFLCQGWEFLPRQVQSPPGPGPPPPLVQRREVQKYPWRKTISRWSWNARFVSTAGSTQSYCLVVTPAAARTAQSGSSSPPGTQNVQYVGAGFRVLVCSISHSRKGLLQYVEIIIH